MSDQSDVDGRLRVVAELAKLHKASTQGKWFARNVPYCSDRSATAQVMLDRGEKAPTVVLDTSNADEVEIHSPGMDYGSYYDAQGMKNAEFTAEAHNEMPWLLACVRELVEMEATTRAAAAELAATRGVLAEMLASCQGVGPTPSVIRMAERMLSRPPGVPT